VTDPNKTLIAALLDRSGSMSTSKAATEEGFNALMKTQAAEKGQALVTLAQFDSVGGININHGFLGGFGGGFGEPVERRGYHPEFIYRMQDITSVPKLNIQPRGGTPLIDCLGEFITEIGRDLAKMREQDRPGTVILMVMTDGEENSSRKWTAQQVKDLIAQQTEVYKWKFMFLGANIDAVETGAALGFERGASMTYNDAAPVAVASAYAGTSNLMSAVRGGNFAASYSDTDRLAAMGGEKKVDEDKARKLTGSSTS